MDKGTTDVNMGISLANVNKQLVHNVGSVCTMWVVSAQCG